MSYSLHDVLGNIGVLLIVSSYVALQFERTTFQSTAYLGANVAGSALILYSLWFDFNLSAFVIEVVWLLTSLLGFGLRRRAVAA